MTYALVGDVGGTNARPRCTVATVRLPGENYSGLSSTAGGGDPPIPERAISRCRTPVSRSPAR
ncbi:hypothetical protein J4732_12295 [Serratia marcescens]|uniref:Glucokinase n=1 Tax=Serratia marcescens TaxID=615 RepID=A0A939NPZ3_SERMA|nr:hypothetical protein [Serratia marcescens]